MAVADYSITRTLGLVRVQKRADQTMVIGRLIDQMQQNVLLDHHASTATDKVKRSSPWAQRRTSGAQIVVVIVHAPQALRHLGKSERSGTMARALPMVAKALTHDKCDQTCQRCCRTARHTSAHFVRSLLSAPAVVSQGMHKQIPAKLTCECFTERRNFALAYYVCCNTNL